MTPDATTPDGDEWASVRAELVAEDPDLAASLDTAAHRFAVAMVAARTERGWSQRQLADAIGVSQPLIARLETGGRDPRLSTMAAVARALNLTLTFAQQDLAAS